MTTEQLVDGWVPRHLPVTARREGARAAYLGTCLALRRNPKRVHLVVSPALAKHVPVAPSLVVTAARDLADLVAAACPTPPQLVVGLAETATGLAGLVADALAPVDYIHSTRMPGSAAGHRLSFREPHSHATEHELRPSTRAFLEGRSSVVLVDDELTTGTTLGELVRALSSIASLRQVVVATLVDARSSDRHLSVACASVGVDPIVVALQRLHIEVAAEAAERARPWTEAAHADTQDKTLAAHDRVDTVDVPAPPQWARSGVPAGAYLSYADRAAALLESTLPGSGTVHVVGVEEQIQLPVLIAERLARSRPDLRVLVSSTTRSPVVVLDAPGYPIRDVVAFGGDQPRFLYNPVRDAECTVLLPDADGRIASGLIAQLPARVVRVRWGHVRRSP